MKCLSIILLQSSLPVQNWWCASWLRGGKKKKGAYGGRDLVPGLRLRVRALEVFPHWCVRCILSVHWSGLSEYPRNSHQELEDYRESWDEECTGLEVKSWKIYSMDWRNERRKAWVKEGGRIEKRGLKKEESRKRRKKKGEGGRRKEGAVLEDIQTDNLLNFLTLEYNVCSHRKKL